MKKRLYLLTLLTACMLNAMQAQVYNEMDADGNVIQRDEYGNEYQNFNPNRRDSVKSNKKIPHGVWAWTVDRTFGDITPAAVDTLPHLYQNSIYATGRYGEYNTIGNNFSSRLSRIFIDRPQTSQFFFVETYDFMDKKPDQFTFLNTLSPFTNVSYDNCGDKQHGEDHIDAVFAVNAGKRLGLGFDLDYYYGRGYYQNQSNAHFLATIYGYYRGDRYQMHLLATATHRKAAENGGITNDIYITHPEQQETDYSEEEIPTVLSSNWNRNNSQHLFLSHRYSVGFYRKVPMTPEEIQARKFAEASARQREEREKSKNNQNANEPSGRNGSRIQETPPAGRPSDARIMGDEPARNATSTAADSTRIQVADAAAMDSLLAVQAHQDSIDATMKREYVPVTSFIHTLDINHYEHIYQAYDTPADYYANTYYDQDDEGFTTGNGIYDKYKYLTVKNTFGIALLEGFNKYVKAGLKGFVSYEYRRFQMPNLWQEDASAYYMRKATDHCVNLGGKLSKTQGRTFHFNLGAEFGMSGADAGMLNVDFDTDLNFKFLGDTVRLAAKAFFHRTTPRFFQESYHSKHLWWDKSLSAETRTHLEGIFSYDKTNTTLRIAIDEIQNYTYFGMSYTATENSRTALTGSTYQTSGNINVITAQLNQHVRWGILNWENVITYQNSSNKEVLPLPDLNLFTNLFLKFKIARVLSVELGGCMTFFTKYFAPDYLPQIAQFAIQQNADSRVKLGGYPFVDVYANMHLKRARFFVSMSHVNSGSGSKMYFLTPHYPTNTNILRFGVSWNFFN